MIITFAVIHHAYWLLTTVAALCMSNTVSAPTLVRYIVQSYFAIAVAMVAFFGAPLWALLCWRGQLLWPIRFLGTHDEWMYGMVTQIKRYPMPDNIFGKYCARLQWIMRNPGYGFAHWAVGYPARRVRTVAPVSDAKITMDFYGDMYAKASWFDAFCATTFFWRVKVTVGWKLWRTDIQDPDGRCMLATKVKWIK